jgi:hypothetical protein
LKACSELGGRARQVITFDCRANLSESSVQRISLVTISLEEFIGLLEIGRRIRSVVEIRQVEFIIEQCLWYRESLGRR